MSISNLASQFEAVARQSHFDIEDPINTEIHRIHEIVQRAMQACINPLQEIGNCFSLATYQHHPTFVRRVLAIFADEKPPLSQVATAALFPAQTKTLGKEPLQDPSAQRISPENASTILYPPCMCVHRALEKANNGLVLGSNDLNEAFDSYWSRVQCELEAALTEYAKLLIRQGTPPGDMERQSTEIAREARRKIDDLMKKDRAALCTVSEMIQNSPYLASFVRKFAYNGPTSLVLSFASLKDDPETAACSSQRDAVWKLLFDQTESRSQTSSENVVKLISSISETSLLHLIITHIEDHVLPHKNEFIEQVFKYFVLFPLAHTTPTPYVQYVETLNDFVQVLIKCQNRPWNLETIRQNREPIRSYFTALTRLVRQIKENRRETITQCEQKTSESFLKLQREALCLHPSTVLKKLQQLSSAILFEIDLETLPHEISYAWSSLCEECAWSEGEQEISWKGIKELFSTLNIAGIKKEDGIKFVNFWISFIRYPSPYFEPFDPFALLNTLRRDQLKDLFEYWMEQTQSPITFFQSSALLVKRMMVFLKNGGTRELFERVLSLFPLKTIIFSSVPRHMLESLMYLLSSTLPMYFTDPDAIREFSVVSDAEFEQLSILSPLFDQGPVSTKEEFLALVRDKEKLAFLASLFRHLATMLLKQTRDGYELDDFVYPFIAKIRAAYQNATAFFESLKNPSFHQESVQKELLAHLLASLAPERWVRLLAKIPISSGYYYCAEAAGLMKYAAHTVPLSDIPTEPLVRLLSSRPFPTIKKWLEERIQTPLGERLRLDTLLIEQRQTLLRRFHQDESDLPLPHWMALLNGTKVKTQYMDPQGQCRPSNVADHVRHEINESRDIDSFDPLSVFAFMKRRGATWESHSIRHLIHELLVNATESTIPGKGTLLTWGNSAEFSLTCAHDTPPLFCRVDGQLYALYQPGLLNDFTYASSAVSLKKICEATTSEEEVFFELDRLAQHLAECYQQLTRRPTELFEIHPEPPPETVTAEQQLENLLRKIPNSKATTFFSLLKETYRSLSHDLVGSSGAGHLEYDRNHSLHRNMVTFMTLLLLARSAKVTVDGDITYVAFSSRVFFRLKSLPQGTFKLRTEDNPDFDAEQLLLLSSKYPCHTLCPITPTAFITPKMVQIFIDNIQAIDELEFSLLFLFYLSRLMKTEDRHLDTATYFHKLKTACPMENILGPEADAILITLTENYVGSIDSTSKILTANSKVPFDPNGLDTYFDQSCVPTFIHSEGNFSSAICSFFRPYKPALHDGNRGVHSFLMGLHGDDAYVGPERIAKLNADIKAFRASIVEYAKEHLEGLAATYSRVEVSALIDYYNGTIQPEWAGLMVWDIAAKVYGRTIKIYSRQGDSFSIDADGEIQPTRIFTPTATNQPEPLPINLMIFQEGHYCLLVRKKT